MTHNQHHAIELARGILSSTIAAHELTDQEWHLMLLAAGTNSYCAPPLRVAVRALQNAGGGVGYFEGIPAVRRTGTMG